MFFNFPINFHKPGLKDHDIIARFFKNRAILAWSCKPAFTLKLYVSAYLSVLNTFILRLTKLTNKLFLDSIWPVEWRKKENDLNKKVHTNNNIIVAHSLLIFKSLDESDFGVYTCNSANDLVSAQVTLKLNRHLVTRTKQISHVKKRIKQASANHKSVKFQIFKKRKKITEN